MQKKKYPYQDISLKNIKGEKWKDLPGLELYFKISSYGRIKRLEYDLEYIDGRVYTKPEKIIKPTVRKIPNLFMNDTILFLYSRVTLYKQHYNFSIARLVYYCFVQSFNLNNSFIVILTKDRNGLNIKPSNLKKATLTEKQKRIFDLKRHQPLVVDNEARQRSIEKSKQRNNKEITQYNMQGEKIKTYPSSTIAGIQTGISRSHISNRASGTEFSAGGFIWRYGNDNQIEITPMLEKTEQRRKRNKEEFGEKVTQYKMNGKRVAVFTTINDAAKNIGISRSCISQVIKKKASSAGGFYWLKGNGPEMIDLSNHQYGEVLRAKMRQRPVEQYSKEGEYLQLFNSIKDAAHAVNVNTTTVIGALTGKHKTAGGYKWKYAKNSVPKMSTVNQT